jgi:hypothetical protein
MQDNPKALYSWHRKVSSMALCVLYSTRHAKKAGRDSATKHAVPRQNEATLITVNERIFIFNLLESKSDHLGSVWFPPARLSAVPSGRNINAYGSEQHSPLDIREGVHFGFAFHGLTGRPPTPSKFKESFLIKFQIRRHDLESQPNSGSLSRNKCDHDPHQPQSAARSAKVCAQNHRQQREPC